MHSQILLRFLCATTISNVIANSSSSTHKIGQWQYMDFSKASRGEWISDSAPRAVWSLSKNPSYVNTASYHRNATSPETTKARLLFVDEGGITWTYSPRTYSWTRLSTSTGSEHSSAEASLARLSANTITALCESRLVFAGRSYSSFNDTTPMENEVWLFNGETETWSPLPTPSQFYLNRLAYHTAFAYRQEESTCHCKDSLFIYATTRNNANYILEKRALWELRCIEDRLAKNMTYEWIESVPDTTQWPVANETFLVLRAFAANATNVYWLSETPDIIRVLNMKTGKWSTQPVANLCPFNLSMNYFRIVLKQALFLKKHLLVIGYIKLLNVVGVYDLKASAYKCYMLNGNEYLRFSLTENVLLGDDAIFHAATDRFDHTVAFTRISEKVVLEFLDKGTFMRVQNSHIETTARSPGSVDHAHRLMSVNDSIWYLMKADPPSSELRMWKFDLEMYRWTLYDPDRSPETPTTPMTFLDAATAVAKSSFIAFFGSKNGFGVSGRDELWIYATSLRTWTRAASRFRTPKKLTSYATMNSLSNGSLILFGGIDNRTNSIWIAIVDYVRMAATWKRLCCDVDKQPQNELLQWASAVWSNRLYVLFGLKKSLDCDLSMYYINLEGSGALKWKTKRQKNRNITFCVVEQSVYGRFAYTTNENGKLLLADLDEMEYKIADDGGEVFLRWLDMLVARNNEVFALMPGGYDEIRYNNSNVEARYKDTDMRRFKLTGCEPGSFSPEYSIYPCQLCPKGEYSDQYSAINCTSCPPNLATSATGSNSIDNCTCATSTCVYGGCVVQSNHTTLCICNVGFTGKRCETPTMYLVGMGIIVGLLLVCAFYYCIKRVRKHRMLAKYTRVELEMAEQMAEELANIWSVKTEEIKFERKIGEGSFGDVWTAEYRDQTVAVKVLKIKADDCTNEQLKEFKDESELLRSIFHANIVRFIGTGKTNENKPFIVLEYMERGSVRKLLDNEYADQPMEIHLQVKYALDAAKGMRHLHRISRMHRDLKCDNLLISDRGVVKVADLGCTKIAPKITFDDDDTGSGNVRGSRAVGTAFFRAPEVFRGEAYSTAIDVYSYGITLWEMQTSKNPYFEKFEEGLTANQILDQIVDGDERPDFPFYCNAKLKKLAISCWNAIPRERPTFKDIVPAIEEIQMSVAGAC
ncbi:uncharacterized protein [Oscarella lobularis]|uniref:uncharacterized protein n=1 Tax=Oscarella lobularis TaxID=121494 RepID=UPI003313D72E